MRLSKLVVLSAATAFLSIAPLAAHADTYDYSYQYSSLGSIYQDNGPAASGNFFGEVGYDVTASTITVTNFFDTFTTFTPASFNGIVITDLSGPITSTVTLDPSSVDPIGTVITVSGNQIQLNFQGSDLNTDTDTIFDIGPSAAATPEPSSLILLGTGALGLAGSMRRRFFKS